MTHQQLYNIFRRAKKNESNIGNYWLLDALMHATSIEESIENKKDKRREVEQDDLVGELVDPNC